MDLKKKAAILARVSREVQETESQISVLNQCANDYGFEVPDELIFQEKITGMDSYDKEERQSLRNLKDAIEKRTDIKAVFIWELSRLSRNPYFLIEQSLWFNNHKMPIYIYDQGYWTRNIETNEENVDVTKYIFGAAHYGQAEWKKIKDRTKRGRDLKAKKGLFVGHIADGYKVVLVYNEKHFAIDEERATIIRNVFDLYVNRGYSTNQIAAEFNAKNIPTFNALEAIKNKDNPKFSQTYRKKGTNIRVAKTQTKWMGSTVSQILHNKWYIGQRTYLESTYSVPAIVSLELFEAAQKLLEKNQSEIRKKTSTAYPLKSLLVCGKCGRFLYGHRSGVNYTYYCSSVETGVRCGLEGIAKQNADWMVWDLIAGNAIMAYARHEDIQDLKTALGYDKINITELEEKVLSLDQEIEKRRDTIKKTKKTIAGCNIEIRIGEYDMKEYYMEIKSQAEKDLDKETKALEGLLKSRSNAMILIEKSESIDDAIVSQLENIIDKKDIAAAERIIRLFVRKITIHSIERYYKFLDIELFSGVHRYALYNYRKFKGYYSIPIANLTYDIATNIFTMEKPIYSQMELNEVFKNKSVSETIKELKLDYRDYISFLQGECPPDQFEQIEQKLNDLFEEYNISKLDTHFTIDQLVCWLKANSELLSLKKLEEEPNTKDYKKWREQAKQWYKKRNRKKLEERKVRRETLNQQYEGYRNRMQIVQELGLKKITVWKDINQKRLPAIKVNGVWLVSPADFESYKELRQVKDEQEEF